MKKEEIIKIIIYFIVAEIFVLTTVYFANWLQFRP